MKNSQTLTLSKKRYTFPILNAIEVTINITENPYELPPEELFTMAARINKKRSFLFVSKVLGKHIPVKPKRSLLTAALLGSRFMEVVKGLDCVEKEQMLRAFLQNEDYIPAPFISEAINPVIIGFAETATALGHAFFDCFKEADFFHTTRENIDGLNPDITFEEEHSHATSHRCYVPREMMENDREIILVDDEITTGKTALNIIRSIHTRFPRKLYTVVSILDWRSPENRRDFARLEKELGITIHVISLLTGKVSVTQFKEITQGTNDGMDSKYEEMSVEKLTLSAHFCKTPYLTSNAFYLKETGRFGLAAEENRLLQQKAEEAAGILKELRTGEKTLCLGTGEFMYVPMRISALMGSGISYQSTTRSPVHIENQEGYGAKFGVAFPNPEDHDIPYFVYNIPPGHYDELFVFFEREIDSESLLPFLKELQKTQIPSLKLVFFSDAGGDGHVSSKK